MRVKLQDRDMEIIEFLNQNKCADTVSLSHIFFGGSLRATQHRMKKLSNIGEVKAFRENILEQNIYYTKRKPTSYKHALKVTQFIAELHKLGIEILKVRTPFKCGKMIADSLIICKANGDIKIIWIEVELTKFFNLAKYEELYYSRVWKEVMPVFGSIVVISDKKVNINKTFNIIKVKTDFSNVENLLIYL